MIGVTELGEVNITDDESWKDSRVVFYRGVNEGSPRTSVGGRNDSYIQDINTPELNMPHTVRTRILRVPPHMTVRLTTPACAPSILKNCQLLYVLPGGRSVCAKRR